MSVSRREFFRGGLATAGVTALSLRADALPTLPSGTLKHYPEFQALADAPLPFVAPTAALPDTAKPTEDNILGPYVREGGGYDLGRDAGLLRFRHTAAGPDDLRVPRGAWCLTRRRPR